MVTPDQLQWSDVASLAPGAQIAVIEGELSDAEPFTFRLKFPGRLPDRPSHPPGL